MVDPIKKLLRDARRDRMESAGVTKEKVAEPLEMDSPDGVELSYNAALQHVQTEINKEERKLILASPWLADPDYADEASAFFGDLGSSVTDGLVLSLPGLIKNQGYLTELFNAGTFNNPIYNLIGFNSALTAEQTNNLLNSWVKENVALIKNTNSKQVAQLEGLFLRSARSGIRGRALTDEVSKIFKGSRSNVKFIASDQISKLDSQLTMAKMDAMGITSYIWRTMGDSRVRPLHRSRNGQVFYLKSPPSDGHAGIPPGCRCRQEPNIISLF